MPGGMAMIRVLASGALAAALASLGGCGSRAEDAEDLAAPDCTLVPKPAGAPAVSVPALAADPQERA